MINFYQHIHHNLQQSPEQELITWPVTGASDTLYTGRQLLEKISRFRHQFISQNVQTGDAVLLAIPVSVDAIAALLAVQSIGAIPVLPPAKAKVTAIYSTIKKVNARYIAITRPLAASVKFLLSFIKITVVQLHDGEDAATNWTPVLVPPEQPALITHSSGSTGKPKAVCRSHRVLYAQHLVLKEVFPPMPGQRDFPLFPNILLHNLASGVHCVLPAIPSFDLLKLKPAAIIEQLHAQHITTLTGNVFYFQRLLQYLRRHPQTFTEVKALGIGGSPVPEYLIHSLRQYFPSGDFYIIYGSSEAEPISVRLVSGTADPANGYAVGEVCEDIIVNINEASEILTPGGLVKVGEIEVKGAHVATTAPKVWLQTGDMGFLRDGQLHLTARKGNEGVYNKTQHYQVEHVLMQHASIFNAAAIFTAVGFKLYIEGEIRETEIWKMINNHFITGTVKEVHFMKALPVDARHHSKILYNKLK